MTVLGVPDGANSPMNCTVMSCGKPTSVLIGICGAPLRRRLLPATRMRIAPRSCMASTCGEMLAANIGNWPA